ncbi:MAG: hypothetical protein ACQCN3_02395 [Candidatus Bathyarchaeia archaeon]|jgi:hypothetical protein
MDDFKKLITELSRFKLTCSPFNEAEIEKGVADFLKKKGFDVNCQVVNGKDRFDLVVGNIVIEAKLTGFMNVAAQLDRYSAKSEGLILLCWRATKPLKNLFKVAKLHSKIPIELVELNKNCDLV